MRKALVLGAAGLVAAAYGLGTSGLPGPWIAQLVERLIGA
jgi:hypothetical protein